MNIISFGTLYSIVTFFLFLLFIAIILSHLASRFLYRAKPLKLNPDSIIVIAGGCMGIGKIMAIQLAKLYHSTIIIIDRRKDLFADVSN